MLFLTCPYRSFTIQASYASRHRTWNRSQYWVSLLFSRKFKAFGSRKSEIFLPIPISWEYEELILSVRTLRLAQLTFLIPIRIGMVKMMVCIYARKTRGSRCHFFFFPSLLLLSAVWIHLKIRQNLFWWFRDGNYYSFFSFSSFPSARIPFSSSELFTC